MKSFLFLLAFSLALTQIVNAGPVVQPVHPQLLLDSLPAVPANWKLLSSSGSNELMGSGEPVTFATRRYEIRLEDKSQEPPVVKTVNLKLVAMDVGSRTETVQTFRSRLASVGQGDETRKKIEFGSGVVGVFRSPSEGVIKCNGLCGDRLALQMESQGADAKEFVSLFQSVDFGKLAALGRRLPSSVITSGRYTLHIVDELNPKKNRSYQAGTVDFSQEIIDTQPKGPTP
jgi:hypothetical protein